jgi:hypothetical protein
MPMERRNQDKKGFTIWKGFSDSGAFSICYLISLESLVTKKSMDLEV